MLLKIVSVWLVSTLISSPMFVLGLVDSSNVYTQESRECSPNHDEFKLVGSVFAFCIPFAIITVTYSFTMRALKMLMRSKEEVRRRLSRDRRGGIGDEMRDALAMVTSRTAGLALAAYERTHGGGDLMGLRREFVERRRSFCVPKPAQPSTIRAFR